MITYSLLSRALVCLCGLAWALSVLAAGNCANGEILYNTPVRNVSCSNASCHGPDPSKDLNFIMWAANKPANLAQAIRDGGGGMSVYQGRYTSGDLEDLAAWIGSAPKCPATEPASNRLDLIEYYYAEFDSYFVTALTDEIQKLDSGEFAGWTRTGLQFKVNVLDTPGSLNVCRFYSVAFGLKSAHFYTPAPDECARLKTNPDWIFEGEVFAIPPARADGFCVGGPLPIFRLYNNGQGGAPNHRYTTSIAIRDAMVKAGWVIEGNGPGFAFMCAP